MSNYGQALDGARVKRLRKERPLSQVELAQLAGTTQATISEIERGKRRVQYRTARELAAALGVEVRDLLWQGRVVNIKSTDEPYDVYIGRAVPRRGLKQSIWHNPFKVGDDGTREEVLAKYERYLLEKRPDLLGRVHELRGSVLACWCAPEPCHGDVLLKLAWERT